MKTFRDLKLANRSDGLTGKQATMFFPNGYGVSVITGPMFYTDPKHPYELAVLKGNGETSTLCYDTPITDDVIGHLTGEKVSKIMKQVQEL